MTTETIYSKAIAYAGSLSNDSDTQKLLIKAYLEGVKLASDEYKPAYTENRLKRLNNMLNS